MGTDDSRNHDDPNRDEYTELYLGLRLGLGGITTVLRTLGEEGNGSRVGHDETGRASVNDETVRIGLGPAGRRSRPTRFRYDRPSNDDYRVTVRESENGLVVVADLTGVDAHELTVGVGRRDDVLAIAVGDEVVERVSLPCPVQAEWGTFKNGVLEVGLRVDE